MPRTSLLRSPLANQGGKGTTSAMLVCLVSLLLYLRFGRSFFLHEFGVIPMLMMQGILMLISAFTIGCVIHMIILGEVSLRDFRRKIEREAEQAAKFSALVAEELSSYEQQACIYDGSLTPRTVRALETLRRISAALKSRSARVRELLQQQHKTAWCEAVELLQGPLHTDGDCCKQLILGERIDPIEQDELRIVLRRLFKDIDDGLSFDTEEEFGTTLGDEFGFFSEYRAVPARPRLPTIH